MTDPVDRQKMDYHVTSRVSPSYYGYWAWSEQAQRWIDLTFQEHRAWLTRPDLDPVEFASGVVAS